MLDGPQEPTARGTLPIPNSRPRAASWWLLCPTEDEEARLQHQEPRWELFADLSRALPNLARTRGAAGEGAAPSGRAHSSPACSSPAHSQPCCLAFSFSAPRVALTPLGKPVCRPQPQPDQWLCQLTTLINNSLTEARALCWPARIWDCPHPSPGALCAAVGAAPVPQPRLHPPSSKREPARIGGSPIKAALGEPRELRQAPELDLRRAAAWGGGSGWDRNTHVHCSSPGPAPSPPACHSSQVLKEPDQSEQE